MDNFLVNDTCNFKILNKAHLLRKGCNIVTSVFFKRDSYYKNFGIYVKGLDNTLRFMDNKDVNPDDDKYIFLLFIDQNIADDDKIMQKIDRNPNTVPVLFTCSKYMVGRYHVDVFGTLLRFFPMFDFDNNIFNIVICIDLDLHDDDLSKLSCAMRHKPNGVSLSAEFPKLLYHGLPVYGFAGMVCYNKKNKMKKNILLDFIENANQIESKGYYGKRLTTFGYGIDEIFLNMFFLPALTEYKAIVDYQLSYFFFHSKSHLTDKSKIDTSNEILSMILDKYSDEKMSVEDKFNFIDKNTYLIRKLTEVNNEISRRFTLAIDYLQKNNKHWFEEDVQHFIYKYLKNIISAHIIVNTNTKGEILDVELYDAIVDADFVRPGYIKEKNI